MSEREILEIEVSSHRVRVEELGTALRELEAAIGQSGTPRLATLREASLLRMELKGRAAAVEVGSARLRMLPG